MKRVICACHHVARNKPYHCISSYSTNCSNFVAIEWKWKSYCAESDVHVGLWNGTKSNVCSNTEWKFRCAIDAAHAISYVSIVQILRIQYAKRHQGNDIGVHGVRFAWAVRIHSVAHGNQSQSTYWIENVLVLRSRRTTKALRQQYTGAMLQKLFTWAKYHRMGRQCMQNCNGILWFAEEILRKIFNGHHTEP